VRFACAARGLACAALLLLLSAAALAHKPSDAYLTLSPEAGVWSGRLDLALRDLEQVLSLDADGDGRITWGELRARAGEIDAYALGRLRLAADGTPCASLAAAHRVDHHTDGAYAVLLFRSDCASAARALSIDYGLFFDVDPQHRGLLRLESPAGTRSAIFAADARRRSIELGAPAPGRELLEYTREGVLHIAVGFDHLLFLASLLLPAALQRGRAGWTPAPALRPVLAEVLRIVTSFTAAHSLTLGLAAAGLVALPARAVESVIAASVALAAVNNVVPLWRRRAWLVAFVFGLVHGLGFASVLVGLGLEQGSLAVRLAGFNLGVEAGQLTLVGCLLPLLYAVRAERWYRRFALPALSFAIAALAGLWLLERSVGIAF
jgi:hypothetical protein